MRCRTLFAAGALFVSQGLFAQDPSLGSLMERIEARMGEYREYDGYSVSVVSTSREMDRDWKPKKVVVVEKQVVLEGEERREIILKATEYEKEKEKEKDVTGEYREEERKRREKAVKRRGEREEEASSDEEHDGKRSLSLGMEQLFPFSPEMREKFSYEQLPDTVVSERPVVRIRTRAKEKDRELYEGVYYVDPETYTVRRVDVRPSKNPKFVKEMRVRMWFEVLEGKYYVVTATRMRVYAGMLIKKIRMEVEETYQNYRIRAEEDGENGEESG